MDDADIYLDRFNITKDDKYKLFVLDSSGKRKAEEYKIALDSEINGASALYDSKVNFIEGKGF